MSSNMELMRDLAFARSAASSGDTVCWVEPRLARGESSCVLPASLAEDARRVPDRFADVRIGFAFPGELDEPLLGGGTRPVRSGDVATGEGATPFPVRGPSGGGVGVASGRGAIVPTNDPPDSVIELKT